MPICHIDCTALRRLSLGTAPGIEEKHKNDTTFGRVGKSTVRIKLSNLKQAYSTEIDHIGLNEHGVGFIFVEQFSPRPSPRRPTIVSLPYGWGLRNWENKTLT